MLRYTGHPIVDVGVATVTAFCGKSRPEDLTIDDLSAVAEYLLQKYVHGPLKSYLSCVFTMNATYTQPSWPIERREKESRDLLFSFTKVPEGAREGLRCAFSGEPASTIAYRQHVPMITGEGVLNFFPAGLGGLPIAAPYLLAIQAFPLGARRCHGRALAVHSPDDHALTYAFAKRFLQENRRLLLLTEESGERYPDAKAPKTLIVHTLLEIERERQARGESGQTPSLTVYHLTNSGQGPDIDIFHLPAEIVAFVRAASRAGTSGVWSAIQAAAWERQGDGARRRRRGGQEGAVDFEAAAPAQPAPGVSRNFLYEDLFELPHNAARFVRTYFLRRSYRSAREGDPRREYHLARELELVSWDLTELFLKEVIGMDKNRIEAIRTLGDRIARHIAGDNDRRLFQALYLAKAYPILRNLLIKASNARLKKGQEPLIGFDEFLLIFEEGEELARVDWALARDLVLIRVIEQLYREGWFGREPEALEGLEDELEETETAAHALAG